MMAFPRNHGHAPIARCILEVQVGHRLHAEFGFGVLLECRGAFLRRRGRYACSLPAFGILTFFN